MLIDIKIVMDYCKVRKNLREKVHVKKFKRLMKLVMTCFFRNQAKFSTDHAISQRPQVIFLVKNHNKQNYFISLCFWWALVVFVQPPNSQRRGLSASLKIWLHLRGGRGWILLNPVSAGHWAAGGLWFLPPWVFFFKNILDRPCMALHIYQGTIV